MICLGVTDKLFDEGVRNAPVDVELEIALQLPEGIHVMLLVLYQQVDGSLLVDVRYNTSPPGKPHILHVRGQELLGKLREDSYTWRYERTTT